jgi:predicted RNA-binding Zn-ribbon protein involved in translation (DUF1610 family)
MEHRDGSLEELEQAVLEAVRAALPELLSEVVEAASSSIRLGQGGVMAICPECGERTGVQSWRQRTVLTVCGKVQFERPWYVCSQCSHNWSPTDCTLQLDSRIRLSPGILEWLIRLGASSVSFVEAAGVLDELTGLKISPETVRQRTEQRGALLEEGQQQVTAQVVKTREAAEPVDQAPGVLVVEADGAMVRYLDGWHEVKLGLVAGQVDGELIGPSYIAARESAEQFGPRLLAEAARRGALEVTSWQGPINCPHLAILPEVVVLGDGARWIWNLAEDHFGNRTEVVDFYHASEHLWDVAKALYGEGTTAASAWADKQIRVLLKQGVKPVLQALIQATPETSQAAEVLRKEINYFRSNAARMDYPAFRARGLPIGSGAIESAAKHLVQQRLKRPGARWSEPGAQSVLAVRSRIVSGRPLAA